jgi:hypothetical protein
MECLHLIKFTQSEVEARLLKDLAQSWVRIANQTERYHNFTRTRSPNYPAVI